jgi:hypothetical protein
MVGMVAVRLGALALAGLLALACWRPPATPTDAVRAYFHALGEDPIRTLPLLTDDFHRHHGLRFEEAADSPFESAEAIAALRSMAGDEAEDPDYALTRARLGWVTAIAKSAFIERVPRFDIRYLSEEISADGTRAVVRVEVREFENPPVTLVYRLARDQERGGWLLDGIRIRGIVDHGTRLTAFLAAPDITGLRYVHRWLRGAGEQLRERRREGGRPGSGRERAREGARP